MRKSLGLPWTKSKSTESNSRPGLWFCSENLDVPTVGQDPSLEYFESMYKEVSASVGRVSEVKRTSTDHDSRAGSGLTESREDKLLQLMEMMLTGML